MVWVVDLHRDDFSVLSYQPRGARIFCEARGRSASELVSSGLPYAAALTAATKAMKGHLMSPGWTLQEGRGGPLSLHVLLDSEQGGGLLRALGCITVTAEASTGDVSKATAAEFPRVLDTLAPMGWYLIDVEGQ